VLGRRDRRHPRRRLARVRPARIERLAQEPGGEHVVVCVLAVRRPELNVRASVLRGAICGVTVSPAVLLARVNRSV